MNISLLKNWSYKCFGSVFQNGATGEGLIEENSYNWDELVSVVSPLRPIQGCECSADSAADCAAAEGWQWPAAHYHREDEEGNGDVCFSTKPSLLWK